jgi:rhodanese-related sulfurtransferase
MRLSDGTARAAPGSAASGAGQHNVVRTGSVLLLLLLLCALTALLLTGGCADDAGPAVDDTGAEPVIRGVTAHEAAFLTEKNTGNESFVILDVRRPDEYASGAIEGAINIDYSDPDFSTQIGARDRERTYLVYCKSGVRSSNAANIMEDLGFKKIYTLEGGIDAWQSAGYRVVIPESVPPAPG